MSSAPSSGRPSVARVRELLAAPPSATGPLLKFALLVGSIVLFVVALDEHNLEIAGFLVLALLIHELGHFLGMRFFGYRDVKMFFVPFLGAAVTGRNETAPAWQQGTVLLLGPLPGIALGCALVGVALTAGVPSEVERLALMFVLLNGFNLLPVSPLDGGRLLEVLLFNRYAVLAAAFRILTAVGLLALALALQSKLFFILGIVMVGSVALVYRQSAGVAAFRRKHADVSADPAQLTDEQLGELIGLAYRVFPQGLRESTCVEWVRTFHGNAVAPRATAKQALVLLVLYALGVAGAGAVAVLVFGPQMGLTV